MIKEKSGRAPSHTAGAPPPEEISRNKSLAVLFSLSLVAILIYSNTFSASFHFDDLQNIERNPRIHDLKNFIDFSGSRYIGFLSFALNYHFGGLHLFGYHLVNVIIHIVNASLVYLLILLILRTVRMSGPEGGMHNRAFQIAFGASLLFAAHPIQTQAVTYIVQRFASLATLFYLLALVFYLQSRLNRSDRRIDAWKRVFWYGAALLSALLAMKTKEISFTLPIMILLVEAVFLGPLKKKQWVSLIPFLSTPMIYFLSTPEYVGQAEAGFTRQTSEISRFDYLFTQFRVIMTYLRLLIFPVHQSLDYDYSISHSLFEPAVIVSFLFFSALFLFSLYLLFFSSASPISRLAGFGILWFFVTLSIESSVIPIIDVIFEHRLYLPSIGIFMAFSGALMTIPWPPYIGRMVAFGTIVVVLMAATHRRNFVWKDDLTLWQDVIKKAPARPRGHNNLGLAYYEKGMQEAAVEEYRRALALKPGFVEAHTNLGIAYAAQGRREDAIEEYRKALALKPDFVEAITSLGVAYAAQGRVEEAIQEYQRALTLKPDDAEAYNNLGAAHAIGGQVEAAIQEYQKALALRPDYVEAHNNLGSAYALLGRFDAAVQEYQKALALKSDSAEAHYYLGNVHAAQRKLDAAIEEYRKALILKPGYAEAHYYLGNAQAAQGRLEAAGQEYQKALALRPDYLEARNNLGVTYENRGMLEAAVQEYQKAIMIKSDYAKAYLNLGSVYRRQGEFGKARMEFERALKINPNYVEARAALESLPR